MFLGGLLVLTNFVLNLANTTSQSPTADGCNTAVRRSPHYGQILERTGTYPEMYRKYVISYEIEPSKLKILSNYITRNYNSASRFIRF
jgi:hypothetical protein